MDHRATGKLAQLIEAMSDESLRRVDLDGQEHRHYQKGAAFKVSDVTDEDLDQVLALHGIGPDRVVTG